MSYSFIETFTLIVFTWYKAALFDVRMQGYNRVGQVLSFRSMVNASYSSATTGQQLLHPADVSDTSVFSDLHLRVIGPSLSIYIQANPTVNVEAGLMINFTTTLFHAPGSTDDIIDLQVS